MSTIRVLLDKLEEEDPQKAQRVRVAAYGGTCENCIYRAAAPDLIYYQPVAKYYHCGIHERPVPLFTSCSEWNKQ